MKCRYCEKSVSINIEMVDIGGLKLCVKCFVSRTNRESIPCEVCGNDVSVNEPNPLIIRMVCQECTSKADLCGAWDKAYKRGGPCDKCGDIHSKYFHATTYGTCLCHSCYLKNTPCTQCYHGDQGGSPFPSKSSSSVLAALLPFAEENQIYNVVSCVVCEAKLVEPYCSELKNLPPICQKCDGSKWWDKMDHYR